MMTTTITKSQIKSVIPSAGWVESTNKKHVLIIGHDMAWITCVLTRLNPYYRLKSCTTAKEALSYMHKTQLQNEQVDLILLDNVLPDMLALELLFIIKRDNHLKHLPVILSCGTESKVLLRNASIKPDLYLKKPCSGHETLSAITSILGWPISGVY